MEEEKLCCRCKYMTTLSNEEPCKSCRDRSNWESSKEEVAKCCCNCEHMSTSYNEEPCRHCREHSKWESRRPKFRTGVLVVLKDDHKKVKSIYIYLRNKWVLYVPARVYVGSLCDRRLTSDVIDKLIANNKTLCSWVDDIEYASPEDISNHDYSARHCGCPESLNDWFSEILEEETEKKAWTVKDPGLGYKDYGIRYDKFPTLNGNFIKNVIFSDPATIIFWEDGTKTVVKTQDGEKYDKEKGFAMAVCKKVFGNERDYYHVFKRWMRKGKEVNR